MLRIRAICFTLLLLAVPLCWARDLAVIVNKSNTVSTVTSAELEKLLKAGAWPDGKKVKVFLTDPTSADQKTILQRVYRMTPAEIKTFAESHKADIHIVPSDDIVLTTVDNTPGAIGIVNVYSISSKVKVLKIDDKLPMEQGYLLHGN